MSTSCVNIEIYELSPKPFDDFETKFSQNVH